MFSLLSSSSRNLSLPYIHVTKFTIALENWVLSHGGHVSDSARRATTLPHKQQINMVLAAVGQFCATSSLSHNAALIGQLVKKASAVGAKVLFLPEASDYISGGPSESLKLAVAVDSNPVIVGIRQALKDLPANAVRPEVSIGVHEPGDGGNRVKNTLLWLDSDGVLKHRYQKIHLFDVEVPNGPILKESLAVEPGNAVVPPFDTPLGKVGSAICYDVRFPEMALKLRTLGAEILLYPSAFTTRTGAAHWEVLARARAIDTQCYVIMAALVGKHDPEGKRQSYGHSLIVDPWGTVLAQAPDVDSEPRIITADIDLSVLKNVRENMPLWEQRRPDIFGPA